MNKFLHVWGEDHSAEDEDYGYTDVEDAVECAKNEVQVNNQDTTDTIYVCKIVKVVTAKQKITVKDIK